MSIRQDGLSGVESVDFHSGSPPPRSSWGLPYGAILEFLGVFMSSNFYLEALKCRIGGSFGL